MTYLNVWDSVENLKRHPFVSQLKMSQNIRKTYVTYLTTHAGASVDGVRDSAISVLWDITF